MLTREPAAGHSPECKAPLMRVKVDPAAVAMAKEGPNGGEGAARQPALSTPAPVVVQG